MVQISRPPACCNGTMVRLETGENEMRLLWKDDTRNQIVKYFKSIGYTYITVDLEGYRTGSMNETLCSDLMTDYNQK